MGTSTNETMDAAENQESETTVARIDHDQKTEIDNTKGESRFSDDGMETEIEVTPEETEDGEETKAKRKKKKNPDRSQKNIENAEEQTVKPNKQEQPIHQNSQEKNNDVEGMNKNSKEKKHKGSLLSRFFKDDSRSCRASSFLFFFLACIMPAIAIYSFDVIISVNVLEIDGLDLVKDLHNMFNNSATVPLGDATLLYKHEIEKTVLREVQRLRQERVKRESPDIVEFISSSESSIATNLIDSVDTSTIISSTTSEPQNNSTKFPQEKMNSSSPVSNLSTKPAITSPSPNLLLRSTIASNSTMVAESKVSTKKNLPNLKNGNKYPDFMNDSHIPRNRTGFCKGSDYFLAQHRDVAKADSKADWYQSKLSGLKRYQQALFFMFTVIGFLFLLTSIGLRFDAYFRERWSSSLLVMFILYAVSLGLTAKVFALQTGSNGLRCFLCQMISYCNDIDPWNMSPNVYFPVYLNWNLVAVLSIVFKLYDCIAIGCLTLKFILDPEYDAMWVMVLKMIGWLIIFPIMVFTPFCGIVRYDVLQVALPGNDNARLAFEIIFYIGVAFWGLSLIILPIFCKYRMCNDQVYNEDEEYDDEDY